MNPNANNIDVFGNKANVEPEVKSRKEKMILDFTLGKIYRIKKEGEIVECGSETSNGYLQFGLNGKTVLNHRYLMSQYLGRDLLPEEHINHVNHCTTDNRIDNLEIVSCAENSQWTRKHSDNKSGCKNISWHKQHQKWRVEIREGQKYLFQKLFDNLQEAIQARDEKIAELNFQGKKFFLPENEKSTQSKMILDCLVSIQNGIHNY